jgi:putative flippase GtrA
MISLAALLRTRAVRFVIVGGTATLLLMTLTYVFLRAGWPPFPAGLCAYGLSFVYAYLMQRNWTFGAVGRHARTLPRYFALQLALALASGGLSQVLVRTLKWPPAEASATMTLCVSAISYLGSSRWVFAGDKSAD